MNKSTLLLVLLFPLSLCAQIGGERAFSFIDIETSPRIEAMGGTLIAVVDYDVSLAQTTPSLLNYQMIGQLAFNFIDYFTDINAVSVHYANNLKRIGVYSIGIDAYNYGTFNLTDATVNELGTFTANDQVITLGLSKMLNNKFSLGTNVRLLNSNYERYHAFALGVNISTTYFHAEKYFTATFLVKNLGRQLISYTSVKEPLPYNVLLGLSKELKHLPFRYSLVFDRLNKFDISSDFFPSVIIDPETQEEIVKEESIAKKVLRHLTIGGELNPFRKSIYLRVGFNFQKRFDMRLTTFPAMVGFSWGLGFKVSKFQFNYSRSAYHLSGVTNNFGIATNLSTFGL